MRATNASAVATFCGYATALPVPFRGDHIDETAFRAFCDWQVAQGVAARNVSPAFLAQRSLRSALFPSGDPSLRMSTPESVRALTEATVRGYYRRVFRPDLTSLVIIGKVTPEAAAAAVQRYFGAWSAAGTAPPTDLPQAPPNRPGVVAVPNASRVQDRVVLAENLALTRTDPDYYPLELGNAVLGGSFYSTRLSIDLRKNAGLVYGVESVLQAGPITCGVCGTGFAAAVTDG